MTKIKTLSFVLLLILISCTSARILPEADLSKWDDSKNYLVVSGAIETRLKEVQESGCEIYFKNQATGEGYSFHLPSDHSINVYEVPVGAYSLERIYCTQRMNMILDESLVHASQFRISMGKLNFLPPIYLKTWDDHYSYNYLCYTDTQLKKIKKVLKTDTIKNAEYASIYHSCDEIK